MRKRNVSRCFQHYIFIRLKIKKKLKEMRDAEVAKHPVLSALEPCVR